MVAFLPSSSAGVLTSLLLTESAHAFMLRTPKASPRMDESSFRLEQVGVTPEQMSVVTFQNDTSLFGVFEKTTDKEEEEEEEEKDEYTFVSSYQGLTGPSKAGLVLAMTLTAGMVYAAPDLDLGNLAFQLDTLDIANMPADFSTFASSLHLPDGWQMEDWSAQVQSVYQASLVKMDTVQESLMRDEWGQQLAAIPQQVQGVASNLWMQFQAKSQELLENALPAVNEFYHQAENKASEWTAGIQASGMKEAMSVKLVEMQSMASTQVNALQDTINKQASEVSLSSMGGLQDAMTEMQTVTAAKTAALVASSSAAMQSIASQVQETGAVQTAQFQEQLPQITNQWKETMSVKASGVQDALPGIQETLATKVSEVQKMASTQLGGFKEAATMKASEAQSALPGIKETLSMKAAEVQNMASTQMGGLKETATMKASGLQSSLPGIQEAISTKAAEVQNIAALKASGLQSASPGIKEAVSTKAAEFQNMASSQVGGLKETATMKALGFQSTFSGIKETISMKAPEIQSMASTHVSGVNEAVVSVKATVVQDALPQLTAQVYSVKDTIPQEAVMVKSSVVLQEPAARATMARQAVNTQAQFDRLESMLGL